ncbi:MAG: DegV family protein [Chloroflexota bacterium]
MAKIALVTDSTCNLPGHLLQQYNIHIAPQVLIWDDQTYADGVDIQPEQFYERLKNSKSMPSTSQATPATFQRIFSKLLAEEYQVLAVLISHKLSGTIQSAMQVLDGMPGAPVEIVDSNTVSMALGWQVLAAARAIEAGAGLAEARAVAEQARDKVGVVLAVDTLEFLHRGGRIGGASRYLATALNIKPILEVVNGRVEAVERVRTRTKSLARLVEIVAEKTCDARPVRLASLNANSAEEAREVLELARGRLNAVETFETEVSPVIGAHAGPGTVALAYMAGL